MFAAPSRKAAAARVARGPRGFDVGAPAPVAEADLEPPRPLWDLSDAGCRAGSNQWRGFQQDFGPLSLGHIRLVVAADFWTGRFSLGEFFLDREKPDVGNRATY